MVQIGEIVQLRISEKIVRPLLVVNTSVDGTAIFGEVFLDWELDGSSEWVKANLFYQPHPDLRNFWVKAARQGNKIGEWQPRLKEPPAQFGNPPARKRLA